MCGCIYNHRLRGYEVVCPMHEEYRVKVSKPRFTVASPPRVHEIARMWGTRSRTVMDWLEVMGCPVKSASSRVPLADWHALYPFYKEYLNY